MVRRAEVESWFFRRVRESLATGEVLGAAAVVHHASSSFGEVDMLHIYGSSDARQTCTLTEHDDICGDLNTFSLVTSLAVLALISKKVARFDDDANAHILGQPFPSAFGDVCTVSNLLGHTSGITATVELSRPRTELDLDPATQPSLAALARLDPVQTTPAGTIRAVNMYNALALAAMLETCTRLPLHEAIISLLLEPLAIERTALRALDLSRYFVADGICILSQARSSSEPAQDGCETGAAQLLMDSRCMFTLTMPALRTLLRSLCTSRSRYARTAVCPVDLATLSAACALPQSPTRCKHVTRGGFTMAENDQTGCPSLFWDIWTECRVREPHWYGGQSALVWAGSTIAMFATNTTSRGYTAGWPSLLSKDFDKRFCQAEHQQQQPCCMRVVRKLAVEDCAALYVFLPASHHADHDDLVSQLARHLGTFIRVKVVSYSCDAPQRPPKESAAQIIKSQAQEVLDAVRKDIGKCKLPAAFWGHGHGALVAACAACMLSAQLPTGPVHLFVSGCTAPDFLPRAVSTVAKHRAGQSGQWAATRGHFYITDIRTDQGKSKCDEASPRPSKWRSISEKGASRVQLTSGKDVLADEAGRYFAAKHITRTLAAHLTARIGWLS